jgi:hypothetical protein
MVCCPEVEVTNYKEKFDESLRLFSSCLVTNVVFSQILDFLVT